MCAASGGSKSARRTSHAPSTRGDGLASRLASLESSSTRPATPVAHSTCSMSWSSARRALGCSRSNASTDVLSLSMTRASVSTASAPLPAAPAPVGVRRWRQAWWTRGPTPASPICTLSHASTARASSSFWCARWPRASQYSNVLMRTTALSAPRRAASSAARPNTWCAVPEPSRCARCAIASKSGGQWSIAARNSRKRRTSSSGFVLELLELPPPPLRESTRAELICESSRGSTQVHHEYGSFVAGPVGPCRSNSWQQTTLPRRQPQGYMPRSGTRPQRWELVFSDPW